MLKNLWLILIVFISSCVLYVEPHDPHHHEGTSERVAVWEVLLSSPYVECDYDAYWDLSRWYLEIYADSYYGPSEVASVDFYINNYDLTMMDYAGDGLWVRSFTSTYYDCGRSLHFDFMAIDYDGYEGFYTYYW